MSGNFGLISYFSLLHFWHGFSPDTYIHSNCRLCWLCGTLCDYQPRTCVDLTRLPQKQHPNPWGELGVCGTVLWGSHMTVENRRCGRLSQNLCPHPQTRLRRPAGPWRGGSLLTVQLSPEAAAASDPSQGAEKDTHSQSPALAQSDQCPECRSCTVTLMSAGLLPPFISTQAWPPGLGRGQT